MTLPSSCRLVGRVGEGAVPSDAAVARALLANQRHMNLRRCPGTARTLRSQRASWVDARRSRLAWARRDSSVLRAAPRRTL